MNDQRAHALIPHQALTMAGLDPATSSLPVGPPPGPPEPVGGDGPGPAAMLGAVGDALAAIGPGELEALPGRCLGRVLALADRLAASAPREQVPGVVEGYGAACGTDSAVLLALAARAGVMRAQVEPIRAMAGRQVPEGCELSARQLLTGSRGALRRVVDDLELTAGLFGHAAEDEHR